jgi:hypothetical protein
VECRCNDAMEFNGQEAEDYASGHLVRDETRTEQLQELYSCPDTGKRWILEWPDATEREPGPARLRAESPS